MKTDEQFHHAKSIFLRACDLETSARAEVIDAACGDDEGLRQEVESLLRHDPMPTMPKSGPTDSDATVRDDDGARRRGPLERVGPYRIIGEIQRGGMGVVYLATREDGRFKRRAAVKVIKRGMDTEEVLRRFELERQVLAALNHPNIARLFDGGETDDGRPYFAMEYVDGLPIDQYCDKHRLRIGERMRLFEQVCRAVHYAHQNLVVHRDLKPGNIMVTENGSPKLLDFGIAKIINPEMPLVICDPTAPQLRVMTPEYASPEQVRGDPIGTASDVYSLGVLLYELVTGHRPYHIRTRMEDEIVRVVCEEDPDRPSTKITESEEAGEPTEHGTSTQTITPDTVCKLRETRPGRLRKSLAGDVDNIVMKALRKETQRRYASAEQFAEDIRNHLCGLPVIARKDSWSYRTTKFLLRHRAGMATAAVLSLALLGGLAGTTWGMTQARARFETMREVANLLLFDVFDDVRRVDMSLGAQQLLAETGLEYLEEARSAAGAPSALVAEVADGYDRLGELYAGRRGFSLGEFDRAEACFLTAREIRAGLLGTESDDGVRLQSSIAANRIHMGDVLRRQGDAEAALGEYRAALAEYVAVFSRTSTEETERMVTVGHLQVGKGLALMGKHEDALAEYETALAIRERLARSNPTLTSQRDLSTAHIRVAARKARLGDLTGARDHYERAKDIRESLFRIDPSDTTHRRDLRWANHFLVDVQIDLKETEAAVATARQNVAILGHAVAMNPRDARLAGDLPLAYALLGRALMESGETEDALITYKEARRLADVALTMFPGNLDYQVHRAETLLSFARALHAAEKDDEALQMLDVADSDCRAILLIDSTRDAARVGLETAAVLRAKIGATSGT